MSKRLRDNISSAYVVASNRLNSKDARRKIVAYVESYDDVFFWRSVLSQMETDRYYFQVTLPTRQDHLERGKKAVLMNLLNDKVGEGLIACVDADYDFLVPNGTESSRMMHQSPYVFHTYAYAIENLQCYAPSLHDVCVAVTLCDNEVFNVEEYLRQYSQIIFPLFVWNIMGYRSGKYGQFTMTEFLRVITMGDFSIGRAQEMLDRLRHKVNRKVSQLQHDYPGQKDFYLQTRDSLKELGVTPDTTYLYIQGHHLFDKVVVPMLIRVCNVLVRQRQDEIRKQSVHSVQRSNELSCYGNSIDDVTPVLKKNLGYMRSPAYQHIVADVKAFLEKKETK